MELNNNEIRVLNKSLEHINIKTLNLSPNEEDVFCSIFVRLIENKWSYGTKKEIDECLCSRCKKANDKGEL